MKTITSDNSRNSLRENFNRVPALDKMAPVADHRPVGGRTSPTRFALAKRFALAALAAALCSQNVLAANLYWDVNGSTPGAGGATPSGNWDAGTANWTTDSTGSSSAVDWLTGSTAVFSAGTDATGSYTTTLTVPQSANGVVFQSGTNTLTGSDLTLTSPAVVIVNSGPVKGIIASAIDGSAGLTKTNSGELVLSGANTFTGNLTNRAGILTLNNNSAGGGGAIVLAQGSGTTVLHSSVDGTTLTNNISLPGLSSTVEVDADTNVTLTLNGAISGTHPLNINGTGTVVLGGANNFSGALTLQQGTLEAAVSGFTLGTSGNKLNVNSNATLALVGGVTVPVVGGVSLNGSVGVGGGATLLNINGDNTLGTTLTITTNTTVGSLAGSLGINGPIIGAGFNLTNVGSGEFDIAGNGNTYNNTVINSGYFGVFGTANAGIGSVTINAGGGLLGDGTAGNVVVSGTILPDGGSLDGSYPETLDTASETWNGGGAYDWFIEDASSDYSGLNISGTLTITATGGNPFVIRPDSLGGSVANFDNTGTNYWTLATASGGISGFSSSAFTINTSEFGNSLGNGAFIVQQSGNNINLLFVQKPQITSGPASQTDARYGTANFSVTVTGTGPFLYQWYDQNNLPVGGNSSSYSKNNLGFSDAGTYTVVVSNLSGYSVTNSAVLTVIKATPTVLSAGGTFNYTGTPHAGSGSATGGGGETLAYTLSYSGTTLGSATYGPTATPPTAAGSYTVIASFAGDANNFAGNSGPANLTINGIPLTVTATGVDKVYDGGTTATVTLGDNRVSGDHVTDSNSSASFADKNVANGKTVSVSGISISGPDAPNYTLVNMTATTTANITKASLTVTATGVDKIYDAGTAATVTLADNHIGSDLVTDGYGSASFSDKNVANGKTVNVIGININGTDAGNYSLANTTASTTANITQASLTVTATGVNKDYDGGTTATVTLADNHIGSDLVTDGYGSASFSDRNVGMSKAVSVSSINITGTDAANYLLANTTASTTASIAKTNITVTASVDSKQFDGTTNSSAVPSVTAGSVQSGDTAAFVQAYTTADVGTNNKTLTPSGTVSDGNGGANYAYTFTSVYNGTITAAPLPPITYVDAAYTGLPNNTFVTWPNGGTGTNIIGFNAFATVQGGVSGVASNGTVNVAAGAYPESVTVGKPLALLGANAGIAGFGTRGAESIVNAGAGNALTIISTNVTVDGFELNGMEGVVATGGINVTVQNNAINASAVGVSASGLATTATANFTLQNNSITLSNQLSGSTPTAGIGVLGVTGAQSPVIQSNNIAGAFYGYLLYDLAASVPTTVQGGYLTGVMQGVAVLNSGPAPFSVPLPSTFALNNLGISGFSGSYPTLAAAGVDFHAGVYVYTATPNTAAVVTGTISNVTITGSGKISGDSAGIDLADFTTDNGGARQNISVVNCNISTNENRGISVTGTNAVLTVTGSTVLGNGFDPYGSGSLGTDDYGYGIIAQNRAQLTVQNCFIANPAQVTAPYTVTAIQGAGNTSAQGPNVVVTDNSIVNNGNPSGLLALQSAGTFNASGNWWGTNSDSTIAALTTGVVDFTPYLGSGTDTDLVTPGFQGDFSSLYVSALGAQTGATGRIQEGINTVTSTGTVNVNAGSFTEQVEITHDITLTGAGAGTVLNSPATLSLSFTDNTPATIKPVVYVHNTANATVENFTLNGNGLGNANNRFAGVGYYQAGGTIYDLTIQGFRDNPIDGNQAGYGIRAYADTTPQSLTVDDCTVSDIQKNGIDIRGATMTATIASNTVTGSGPVNYIAQNGIVVLGATATIQDNTISGYTYTLAGNDPQADASGILIYQGAATIANNSVTASQFGVEVYDPLNSMGIISKNDFSGDVYGVNNISDVPGPTVSAVNNWWGTSSGPSGTANPYGTGSSVGGAVSFGPWLASGSDTQPGIAGFQPNVSATNNPPTQLVFTGEPGGAALGNLLSPQPVVSAEDAYGHVTTWVSTNIVVAIAHNPTGHGVLSGTTTQLSMSGAAAYNDLAITVDGGSGYTLSAAAPGLTSATSDGFDIGNPSPSISSLNPFFAAAGGSAFTLTVAGNGFTPDSSVDWNGVAQPTTFNSSTSLSAAISTGDIANAATVAVTVVNPGPAGGTSSPVNFTVGTVPPAAVFVDSNYTGLAANTFVSWPYAGAGTYVIGYNAFATVQGGVNAVAANGTVNVAAGMYPESVTVGKPLALVGANAGIAGFGARGTESMINAGAGNALTITSPNVTVDGMELNGAQGVVDAGNVGVTVQNNNINAATLGVTASGLATSPGNNFTLQNNTITVSNQVGNTVGVSITGVTGTLSPVIQSNNVAGAYFGYNLYSLGASVPTTVRGGSITGVVLGVFVANNGSGGPSAGTFTLSDLSISGFYGNNGNPQSGVYVYTTGSTTSAVLTGTITNVTVTGVGKVSSDSAGIDVSDWSTGSGLRQRVSIVNCVISTNSNRGIYAHGANAIANISGCTLAGNGFDPVGGGNFGIGIASQVQAAVNVSQCFFVNPASVTGTNLAFSVDAQGPMTVTNCSFDNNGDPKAYFATSLSATIINASGNWWGTTSDTTISNLTTGVADFTPYLGSGTDTAPGTSGFQGDFSSLYVSAYSVQTGPVARIQEGVNSVLAGGTVNVEPGTYNEADTVSQQVNLVGAGSGTSPASATIINGGGSPAITLAAGGAAANNRLTLQHLRLNGLDGVFINSTISYISLSDVAAEGCPSYGVELHNTANVTDMQLTDCYLDNEQVGFRRSTSAIVNGLTIVGGTINGNFEGIDSELTGNVSLAFNNITINGTTFSGDTYKGIYTETLNQGLFENLTFVNCGGGSANGAGLNINLKYANYQNVEVTNCAFSGCGTGDAVNGGAVVIEARDDGSYASPPATLTGVALAGLSITGSPDAIRFGEPGKNNAGPTGVTVHDCSLADNIHNGIRNESQANTVADLNWWGTDSGPSGAANPYGTGVGVSGLVSFAPWLGDGTDTSADVGFQPNPTPTYNPPTQLVFSAEPGGASLGNQLSSQPIVSVEDAFDHVTPWANPNVVVTVANNPTGHGVLTGTTTQPSALGVATFTDLAITVDGGAGYTLSASAPNLTSITSTGFDVTNPLPVITVINPFYTNAGAAGFSLTVTGTGFVPSSSVDWNGVAKTTHFVSATSVTADILTADVASAGTVPVTVVNPAPGGGTSAAVNFTIASAVPPTVVYVDHNYTGFAANTSVNWPYTGSGAYVIGYNAFAKIQDAVNAVASNGTVNIAAGTYTEEVTINQPLSLLGPNAGINPNTGMRAAEAVILPDASDPEIYDDVSVVNAITINANNVSIKGLTLDGYNPGLQNVEYAPPYVDFALTSTGTNFLGTYFTAGGDVFNAAEGINDFHGNSCVKIENNVIQNYAYAGVDLEGSYYFNQYYQLDITKGPNIPATNNYVINNLVKNVDYNAEGYGMGVILYGNVYAKVANNCLTNVAIGISPQWYYVANTGDLNCQNIVSNNISALLQGVFFNLVFGSPSTLSISGNQINFEPTNGSPTYFPAEWDAISIASIQGVSASISNNIISGATHPVAYNTVGYNVYNTPTTGLVIGSGSVSNVTYGVWVNDYDGYQSAANALSTATITGVAISGCQAGVYVQDDPRASGNGGFNVLATVTGNTVISQSGVGVWVQGALAEASVLNNNASITGNTNGVLVDTGKALIQNNDLTGNSVAAIWATNGATVDAGNCTAGNVTGLGFSTGGNNLSGYLSGPAKAIVNGNVGGSPIVLADHDNFGAVAGNYIPSAFNGNVDYSQTPGIVVAPANQTYTCLGEVPVGVTNFNSFTSLGGYYSGSGATVTFVDTTNLNNGLVGSGTIVRAYTVTDGCGTALTAYQTNTVSDTTPPTFTFVPANMTFTNDTGQCGRANVTWMLSAYDTCALAGTASMPASGSTFEIGVTPVINVATDTSGNTTVSNFTVTVWGVTTTALATSQSPSTYGSSITITAAVSVCSSIIPSGTVTFYDGMTQLGSPMTLDGSGMAELTTTGLVAGAHSITAAYSGNNAAYLYPSTSAPLIQQVNQAGSSFVYNGATTYIYDGSAQSPGYSEHGSSGEQTVNYVGTNNFGTVYSGLTAPTNSGVYYVSNTVAADSDYEGATNSEAFVILQATNAIALSSGENYSTYGDSVTFTAAIQTNSLTAADATSNLVFSVDGTPVATNALVNGTSSYTVSTLTATGHDITVSYTGDNNYTNNATADLTQAVNPVTPAFSGLTASQGITYGQSSVTLSGTLSALTTNNATIYPPTGEFVSITIGASNQVTQIGSQGAFSVSFDTASLPVTGSPYTIGYSYNGSGADTNFVQATDGSTSLVVSPAPLTITANNDTKIYGGVKTYGAGSGAFSSSGLQNGETIGSVTITATSMPVDGTAANAPVGNYQLTPSAPVDGTFNTANYSITYNPGTLAVSQLAITVTANAQTKVYGSADPALTYGFTPALVSGDSFAGVLSRAPGENVNTYAIGQGTLALSANYTLNFTGANFTITPAALGITANNLSKTYGQTLTFAGTEFTPYGLQNGETIGHVTITAVSTPYAGTETNAPVGSNYQLAPGNPTGGTFTAGNYTITYTNGMLTVNPALLAITANDQSRVYGVTNPVPTYTVSGFVNGETAGLVTGAPDLTDTVPTNAPVGYYSNSIVVLDAGTLAAPNYAFTDSTLFTNGTLQVVVAQLVPSITAQDKTYDGTTNVSIISSNLTGIVGADNVYLVLGTAGFNDPNVGNGKTVIAYGLTIAGTQATNYALATTTATNTASITPASLQITANNDSQPYTGNPYSGGNGVGYAGFVNDETPGVLGGALAYGGTSQGAVNVGLYSIIPSGQTSGNYSITFHPGLLTIGAVTPVLTINSATAIKYSQQLNASAISGTATNANTGSSVPGLFSFTTPTAVPTATAVQSVTFTPFDSSDYTIAGGTVIVPVIDPAIFTQPTNVTVTLNGNATFNVVAAGSGTVTYQWQQGVVTLPGQTGSSLTLTNVTDSQAGNYSVIITSANGSITSSNASLTITHPPVFLTQPASVTVNQGSTVNFTVSMSGQSPFSYQWSSNGVPVTPFLPVTGNHFTLNNVQGSFSANYSVEVTNTDGIAFSSNAVLTVIVPPTITSQPLGLTNNAGMTAVFTVTNTGSSSVYRWYFNNTNLLVDGGYVSGSATTVLTVSNVLGANSGIYSVTVSNAAGVAVSSNATLTVIDPIITSQPVSVTNNLGAPASFTVAAYGTSPHYQWTQGGNFILGANAATYSLASVIDANAGNYSVIVTNAYGMVTSAVVTLAIIDPPVIMTGPQSLTVNATSNATFTVSYTGTLPSLQWYAAGQAINGATTATLTLLSVSQLNALNYFVVLSNAAGIVTSTPPAHLTVIDPPVITTPPQSLTVNATSNATFTVVYMGTSPNIQWYKGGNLLGNGGNVSGATSATLILTSVSDSDAAGYTVVLSNAAGSVTSTPPAVLSVIDKPVITGEPQSLTVNATSNATFTVAYMGTSPNIQWYKGGTLLPNGVNVSGATSATLTLTGVADGDAASYTVVLTNAAGSVTSAPPAMLTVIDPPIIIQQPASITNNAGTTASFTVVTSGSASTYQWFFDGTNALANVGNISGANAATLTITNVFGTNAGLYSVMVSNAAATQTSTGATLVVVDPVITSQPVGVTNFDGTTVSFSVTAVGTTPLSYQWYVDGFILDGSTNSTLTLDDIADSDEGEYSVVITNYYGNVTSTPAVLETVLPLIVTEPVSLTLIQGQAANFSVGVNGQTPFSYQWQKNGTNVQGATNSILSFGSLQMADAGVYDVIVQNPVGIETSSNATLSVYATAAATMSATATPGGLSIALTGVPSYVYVIQASTNLMTWAPILTNNSPFVFTDTNITLLPRLFYRGIYQP
ncbi:MAG TPA: immunoglobulin domain-containing protein [Candidatus Sulfotelmatobacter sp.]|jgi:hypothetical protein|nr:immunoglobulin domain-containing protein [Candidatus Sulfotelmatobacter sp.]